MAVSLHHATVVIYGRKLFIKSARRCFSTNQHLQNISVPSLFQNDFSFFKKDSNIKLFGE
jgi:hypothetical protein